MLVTRLSRSPVLRRVTGPQVAEAMIREQLTPKGLAHELGVQPRTVHYWRTNGLTAKSGHYGELIARLRLGEDARIEQLLERIGSLEAALRKQQRLTRSLAERIAALEEGPVAPRPRQSSQTRRDRTTKQA